MAKLISEHHAKLDFADIERRVPIQRPARPLTRAAGAHQSDVMHYIARKVGWLRADERDESEFPLIWGLGVAWEEFVVSLYPSMDWQPGELTTDGISVNCDGISLVESSRVLRDLYPAGTPLIEECKFTFKGEITGEDFINDVKHRLWQHQVREYCWQYGPRISRHHVCHVRGDYKAWGPTYKRYIVEWTDAECRQTHELLLRFKDEAMRELGIAA